MKITLKFKFTAIILAVVFLIMSYAIWQGMFNADHIIGAFFSFLFITVIFWFAVSGLIDRPMKKILKAIKKVEEGDLTVRITRKQNDEFSQLYNNFNKMVKSLELAKNEIEMYYAEHMKRAAKMVSLGEMASTIAHEIKNPLAGISSAVQVLIPELDADDPKKKTMNEVLNQVKRLDRAVRDLLTYARPISPKMTYNNINTVLDNSLFIIQQVAKRGQTRIETYLDKNLPEIMIDADQIQQVFINISINAIHAMPRGGILKVSTSLIRSEKPEVLLPDILGSEFDWIRINFEDTGIGIPHDEMGKIFEPFYTKKGKGTGLGLPISQRIVEEHKGRIVVTSQINKGSAFSVCLPVK